MRSIYKDTFCSMSPLIVWIIIIVLIGFFHGVFSILMDVVAPLDTSNFGRIMYMVWVFLAVIIFLVATGWLLMKAQKPDVPGSGW